MSKSSKFFSKYFIKLTIYDNRTKKIAKYIYGGTLFYSFSRLLFSTILCDQYVNAKWFQYYDHQFKKDSKLEELTIEVLDDFNLIDQIEKIKFFTYWSPLEKEGSYINKIIHYLMCGEIINFGVYQFGRTYVGLPSYLEYETVKEINELRLPNGKKINLNSKDGKLILDNMILSKKAKKYLIAEAIQRSTSWENLSRLGIALSAMLFSVFGLFRIDSYFGDHKTKLNLNKRLAISTFGAIFAYIYVSFLLKLIVDNYSKEKIDEFLEKHANEELIDGGLEYYTKLQNRNKTLYNLMGEQDAEYYFKANGDEIKYPSTKYKISEMVNKLSDI